MRPTRHRLRRRPPPRRRKPRPTRRRRRRRDSMSAFRGGREAFWAALPALALLAGCSTPAQPQMMTVESSDVVAIAPGQPGYQTLRVTEVGGGSSTIPIWLSAASNEDFQSALTASLRQI